MKLQTRRFYFVFMAILFVVIATGVIGYALGWRYRSDVGQFERVGAIAVETEPHDANVILDGVTFDHTTPTTVNNLLAGTYHIEVTKDGYYAWQHDIGVAQDKVTRISPLYLIRVPETQTAAIAEQIMSAYPSPSNTYVFTQYETSLVLYRLDSREPIWETALTTAEPVSVLWSRDERYVLISGDNDPALTLSLGTLEETPLSNILPVSISQPRWSSTESDVLYCTSEDTLYRINVFQSTATPLPTHHDQLYLTDDIYVSRTARTLTIRDADNTPLAQLPITANDQISFNTINPDIVLVIDQTTEQLFAYDRRTASYQQIPERIRAAQWSNDLTGLLLYSQHELWFQDMAAESRELLLRTSDTISQADWLYGTEYVIYQQSADRLTILETTEPGRNTYTVSLPDIKTWTMSHDPEQALVATGAGVYQLLF